MNYKKPLINRIFASRLIGFRRYIEKKSNQIWFDYPFGNKPRASREDYLKLAKVASQVYYPEINQFENETGYAIDKEWIDDLALHTQIVIKDSKLCYAHGRVLYTALCNYIKNNFTNVDSNKSINIWETGTARGFSALCMAKALSNFNQSGKIVTFDVLPHNVPMLWNCIDDWDGPKMRAELLNQWQDLLNNYVLFHQGDTRLELPKIKTERIHFAFLDGAHTYQDIMFEFNQIREYQESGDMIVYDDYTPNQFPGLVKAVNEICNKYKYKPKILQAHIGRGYLLAVKE